MMQEIAFITLTTDGYLQTGKEEDKKKSVYINIAMIQAIHKTANDRTFVELLGELNFVVYETPEEVLQKMTQLYRIN